MATHCSIFFKFYLFLAALGRQCYTSFPLVAASRCHSAVAVRLLLIAVVSLVAEHGL